MSEPSHSVHEDSRRDPTRAAAVALGALFAFPRRESFAAALARAEGRLLAAGADAAAEALDDFERAVARLPLEQIEELYTRTFDLSPVCVPFLSVHLFGQESFRRARLMTGLEEAYRKAGFDRSDGDGSELPDHLGVVLRAAEVFSAEEWRELVDLAMARPLACMAGALEAPGARKNPYRHLVEAARRLLGVDSLAAEAPAEPHWRRRAASHTPHPAPLPSEEERERPRPTNPPETTGSGGTR